LRASSGKPVLNTVWDGKTIRQFGARNEVVAINLVLESAKMPVKGISVVFDKLVGPDGAEIRSKKVDKENVFDYNGRNIELFFVRYLQIKGLTRLGYNPTYDEHHIPIRLQMPHTLWMPNTLFKGKFSDRPDANKFYPDIAVPLEAVGQFVIPEHESQCIWADIYIPKDTKAGIYKGLVAILESGRKTMEIPVELEVLGFTLPDTPSAKTMVYFSEATINERYFGQRYPEISTLSPLDASYLRHLWDVHHLVAHRHKLSLIDDGFASPEMMQRWDPVFSGELFTTKNGYDGPGMHTSSGVYSIGTYGLWRSMWSPDSKEEMQKNSDKWVRFFEQKYPCIEYFLYLKDEPAPQDYSGVEQWASWIKNNPGPGRRLQTFVTKDIITLSKYMPSVSLGVVNWGDTKTWESFFSEAHVLTKKYWGYNGWRISCGSFVIEDEGVALRVAAWTQFKLNIDRWFYWQSTGYINSERGGGYETNVFDEASTFGGPKWNHPQYGETSIGNGNGDGVLFYPGTDKLFPKYSYGLPGPIASLRLKLWRRGIQDVDYLTLAAKIDPATVKEIVQEIIPKVMWEVGVTDPKDPTWVKAGISWSINPDDWEKARRKLANIIVNGSGKKTEQ